jgi:catechol 2,3-dioxygenase-like lactoylglutathione lyase family enzyme
MGIKIQDVAYVRFSAPDLDEMEAFLTEFGMVRAERSGDALYMRGLDGNPFLHVTQRSEPRFLAAGFEAASTRDLETLAREEKVTIDALDGPGGGSVVRLTDPNGFRIEVVAGRRPVARIDAPARSPVNDAHATPRLNALKRLPKGPSHVKRVGHYVLNLNNFRDSGSVVQIAPGANNFR